jgi:hypothetical protein
MSVVVKTNSYARPYPPVDEVGLGLDIAVEPVVGDQPPGDDEPTIRIDTAGAPSDVHGRALQALWAWRRTQPARAPLKLGA